MKLRILLAVLLTLTVSACSSRRICFETSPITGYEETQKYSSEELGQYEKLRRNRFQE